MPVVRPRPEQLLRYVPRFAESGAALQRLVSVSAADATYGKQFLLPEIGGIEVRHLPWGELQQLALQAIPSAKGVVERLWLRHLVEHLQGQIAMDRLTDNNVFVVSLSSNPLVEGKPHTWIDVVEQDGYYFHRYGHHWPVQPPNYIGFRYGGKLQSVHHIDSFTVVRNLAAINSNWHQTEHDSFLYELGPAMKPQREIRNGKVMRNARVWCAIDTLLSGAFDTISGARDETQRRAGKGRQD